MKETVYVTATASSISPFSTRPLRFHVPVGEIDVQDGTTFTTSHGANTSEGKRISIKPDTPYVEHVLPKRIKNKKKRKAERRHKMLARRKS